MVKMLFTWKFIYLKMLLQRTFTYSSVQKYHFKKLSIVIYTAQGNFKTRIKYVIADLKNSSLLTESLGAFYILISKYPSFYILLICISNQLSKNWVSATIGNQIRVTSSTRILIKNSLQTSRIEGYDLVRRSMSG